ncbi:MAG TPA: HAMP domain-containing sensor histidine kinase [Cyclobacteriaceae bacterium]|nr:HAMP domain-containing sensor histidine kinase [Cyclobacteriaceae bacterium]
MRNSKVKTTHGNIFIVLFMVVAQSWAQDRISVQVKTFDQKLQPYRNIEVSINGKDYVNMGAKGVAFTELTAADLPIKNILIRNDQLEAASWNYNKSTLEVIVRNKSYRIVHVLVRDENNVALPNLKVTYIGRKTETAITDRAGRLDLPLALDEKPPTAIQFSIEGYTIGNLQAAPSESTLTVSRIVAPIQKPTEIVKKQVPDRIQFRNFDLANLDSVQSLTVFYAVFKNYDRSKMTPNELRRIDNKFNELVANLHSSTEKRTGLRVFIGKITDSTFIDQDVKNLLAQVRLESQTLTSQRAEFDQKISVVNNKLLNGVSHLDEAKRQSILSDLALLERLLIENESRFYKNQGDYRTLINAIKERFFDVQLLEEKLSVSEQQRLDDRQAFRQRLILISGIVIVFGAFIILLIYFSTALRKQKRELETANAEINRINENLEGLVFERTQLLESAVKELDTFLYRASHDMRTPVRSIMGLCNIANKMVQGEIREFVKRISETTTSMDRLLKKLSTISEINHPTDLSPVSISESIEAVRESMKNDIEGKQVDFATQFNGNMVIESYPGLVKTIINNMIENAIFYSSLTEIKPRIRMRADHTGGEVLIQVEDNGIGISDSIQPRVFDMFFKGTEYSKGHGLGLYIVQKAVIALNGTIAVESIPGTSTTFTVTLPLVHRIV